MGIKERLYEFIERKKLSVAEFERSANLSNGYVRSIRDGIGTEKIDSILQAFPDLNLTWLLQGEGEMLKESATDPSMSMIEENNKFSSTSSNIDMRERMKRFIAYKRLSRRRFEISIGVSNSYVQNLGKGMSIEILNRISEIYPELNTNWLITGEGEMLKDLSIDERTKPNSKEFLLVPLIHIDSVGGMDRSNAITDSPQYVERLIPFEKAQEGDVAIYQSGESMLPTISAGSILQIRKVPDWKDYLGYGEIYVVELENGRRITKEISSYIPDPKNYVLCVSHNPNYPDEQLPRTMIRSVWKVIRILIEKGW